jgi:hypothetical protein
MSVQAEEARWDPPPGVVDHSGRPIPDAADFFHPPPAEIGEVVKASTTLKKGQRPYSTGGRLFLVSMTGLLGALLGVFFVLAAGLRAGLGQLLIPLLLGGLCAALGALPTRFRHRCSYVGRRGVTRFVCAGGRDYLARQEIFLFEDAAELRTAQTRHYVNGVYTGTVYTYTWSGRDGSKRYVLSGRYNSRSGNPPAKDPFHFAVAAEVAWSVFLLDLAQDELETFGALQFNLGGADRVRVGPGFIEMHLRGRTERIEAADIGGISLQDGAFTVKHREARRGFLGFGSSGYFSFPYSQMANARLFFLALDRLLGLRFE